MAREKRSDVCQRVTESRRPLEADLGGDNLKLSASYNAATAPQAMRSALLMAMNACWQSRDGKSN